MLLCEAGQDTPEGNVPPEILDSYPNKRATAEQQTVGRKRRIKKGPTAKAE